MVIHRTSGLRFPTDQQTHGKLFHRPELGPCQCIARMFQCYGGPSWSIYMGIFNLLQPTAALDRVAYLFADSNLSFGWEGSLGLST